MTTKEVVDIDSCEDDDDISGHSSNSYHDDYHSFDNDDTNDDDNMRGLHSFGTPIGDDGSAYYETKNAEYSSRDEAMTTTDDDDYGDDDDDACHFTDAGWNTTRQRIDNEMEKSRLATLPPTPHQLQMAEELAAAKFSNDKQNYINIKIRKPVINVTSTSSRRQISKRQQSRSNSNNNNKLGWSSSSDDDDIILNSPKGVVEGTSTSSKGGGGGGGRKKLTLQTFRSAKSVISSGVSTLGSDERSPAEEDHTPSISSGPLSSLAQELKEKAKLGAVSGSSRHRGDSHHEQQQLWSASGPPSNTVSVRCGRGDSTTPTTSTSISNNPATTIRAPTVIPPRHGHTTHTNFFRPLLLIQSNRKAHKGSIYVMKFSPHGGHFLATGGEDSRVCIWQVAPDVGSVSNLVPNSFSNTTSSNGRGGNNSPERFVAGAKEREEAEESIVAPFRTTADSLLEGQDGDGESLTRNHVSGRGTTPPKFDKDILTHEGGSMPLGTDIHMLSDEPYAVFEGHHTAEIIDLAWSQQPPPFVRSAAAGSSRKTRQQRKRHEPFLLSASLDKMIFLWHMSRPLAPLHKFAHADMVTCVDFHPTDDSLFVSGGFDSKLRLWSIADGRVKSYAQCPDIITSAKFTPDSNMIVAGLMKGQVFFYLSNSMKYYTQIDSKNRRGKNKEGCKVTGIEFFSKGTTANTASSAKNGSTHKKQDPYPTQQLNSSQPAATTTSKRKDYMLVTTNDSRLRLFDLDDAYRQVQKFKGLKNMQMQIKSHFSQSGNYLVCGSETGSVYIWENESCGTSVGQRQDGSSSISNGNNHHYENNSDSALSGEGNIQPNGTSSRVGGGTSAFMSKLKAKKGGGGGGVSNILSSTSTAYASFDGCPRKRTVSQKQLAGSSSTIPSEIGGSLISDCSTTTGTVVQQGAVTEAIFAPSECIKDALIKCDLFRTTLQSAELITTIMPNEDFSSAVIVAGDNEGAIRIFLRRSCLDSVIRASGPEGPLHNGF